MPIRVKTPDGVRVFPDGTTPEEIDEVLGAESSPDLAVSHETSTPPARDWGDTATDLLPGVGAAAGAAVGLPLAPLTGGAAPIALAALGGAGGQGVRRIIEGLRGRRDMSKDTPLSAGVDMATEGAIQGGLQAVGGVVGKGLQKGGSALYRGILKPSDQLVAKYGDVAPELVKRGRLITAGGANKSKAAMAASKQIADDTIERMSDAAPYVTPKDAAKYFGDVRKTLTLRRLGGQADELPAVDARQAALRSRMTEETGVGLDLKKATALKREMDRAADAAQRAVQRGATSQLSADNLMDDAVRRGLKDRIEDITGLGPQNAMTRKLMGETLALKKAVKREGNKLPIGGARDLISTSVGLTAGAASGDPETGLGAGLLMRLLANPRGGSMAAIGADRLGKITPDVARLLRGLMMSHEAEP